MKKVWIVRTDDYHMFIEYQDVYRMAGIVTWYKDCGVKDEQYHAVFWEVHNPEPTHIITALKHSCNEE